MRSQPLRHRDRNSSGKWGRYDLAGQTFAHRAANLDIYEIAAARKASQYAVPTHQGLFVYSGNAKSLRQCLQSSIVSGRIRVSRDGRLIFATKSDGVVVYPTGL